MSIIKIDGHGTTARTIDILRNKVENGEIIPGDYYAVELCYNAHKGLGAEGTSEFYPVKFKGINGRELWLSYVTLGYGGEGPRGTQTALKLMEFDAVAENESLLFEQKIVHETFFKEASRDDSIEYHYELMYETSDRLKKIIETGINETTLEEFEREAISLRWEGKLARKFRSVVSMITDKLRFRTADEKDIAFIQEVADYPRKCADAMYAKDNEIANLISKKFTN